MSLTKKVKKANMPKLVAPKFVSLVGSPANRSSFKIIRSQDGKDMPQQGTKRRRKRTAKRYDEGLLSIALPIEMSRQDAENTLIMFGMEDEYEIRETNEGFILARRNIPEDASIDATPVRLRDGMVAYVADATLYAGQPAIRSESEEQGITVVRFEFDDAFFGSEMLKLDSVHSWLDDKNIAIPENKIEVTEGGIIASRYETEKPTKRIQIEEGINAYIIRSDSQDVPKMVSRSVTTSAFGNWGYGHIDFASALADPEYSNRSSEALYVLNEVLDNIVMRSGLPLDERKDLIRSALDQYGSFMGNLIDSMPPSALSSIEASEGASQRSDNEEADMALETQKRSDEDTEAANAAASSEEEVTRNEDQAAESTDEATDQVAGDGEGDAQRSEAETITLTQAELDEKIAAALAAATAPADTQRSEEEQSAEADDPMTKLAKAMQTMAESMDSMVKRQDDLDKKLDEIGGETVIRSDEDNGESDEGQSTSGVVRDTMYGAFGDIGGLRSVK